jgi:hypothetical protein
VGYYAGDYYRGDYYQGDPFSLGGLLKGALGVVGGLGIPGVSTVANVAGRLLGGATPTPVAPAQQTFIAPTFPGGSPGFTGIQVGGPSGGISIGSGVSNIGNPSYPGPLGGSAVTPVTMPGGGVALVPCQTKGTHLNKSTYYRAGQRIPKHTVCVKNRSMNVANGRALRRAIRRAEAFKKVAMKTVRFLNPTKKKRFGGFKAHRKAH